MVLKAFRPFSPTIEKTASLYAPYMAPIADFSYTPLLCKINEQVTFKSTSYDEDGTIDSYQWTIDGKEVSTQDEFESTFTSAGFITVTLTVKDNKGETSKKESTIYVRSNVEENFVQLWTACIRIV